MPKMVHPIRLTSFPCIPFAFSSSPKLKVGCTETLIGRT
jgi:hypothetical protein